MSSFLQKLKVGSVAIDNTLPPDITGVITRRIEKQYVNDPVESLGLTLSDDAEVVGVDTNSPAAKANIPLNFIIYDVNGEYVETREDFSALAANSLNLVIKLQSTAAIAEIIALILREEELSCESNYKRESSRLNLDELSRTTPRYSFLSMEHPLFTRYIKRLESRRDALNQIKQRTKEAQEEQRRLLRKKIEEEMENVLKDSENTIEEEEQQPEVNHKNVNSAEKEEVVAENIKAQLSNENENNLNHNKDILDKEIEDKGNLQENKAETDDRNNSGSAGEDKNKEEHNQESHEHVTVLAENNVQEPENNITYNDITNTEDVNDQHSDQVPPITAEELLALVGLPAEEEQQHFVNVNEGNNIEVSNKYSKLDNPEMNGKVEFFTHPAEKYVLSTGEEVFCSLKERRGPLPSPPPGRPPKIRKIKCEYTYIKLFI